VTPDPERPFESVDEFDWIERCLTPLAQGAPEALGLLDDAAVIPTRPGFDLVISKDALVEGVHFLASDPLDEVARKLLRVNLSDLAAKGAEPYGYFLAAAWPARHRWAARAAFVRGLADDQNHFGLKLFGGDTVSTPGPFTASLTILGWVPQGRMVPRGGAITADVVLVSGAIGDGCLGLEAAQGGLSGLTEADRTFLISRYRRPHPRTSLAALLRIHAHAAADISDGLIADAGRIATASSHQIDLDLDLMPLSDPAARWLALQADPRAARLRLAAGGDDYEIICTAPAAEVSVFIAAAAALGVSLTPIGHVGPGRGVVVRDQGAVLAIERAGYRHA